jgi:hypothetical protein
MRCYIIVRHIYGQKYHRNTFRNWSIASDKGRACGPKGDDLSFVLFTGACISTWNKERKDGERRITYYEIFNKEAVAPRGQKYRYPYVPADLRKKLEKSGFPPPLLAVACCDIMPLNLLTKGERYSFSKQAFSAMLHRLAAMPDGKRLAIEIAKAHDQAGEWGRNDIVQQSGAGQAIEISNAHFRGDTLGKTRNFTSLILLGDSEEEAERQCAAFLEADWNPDDFAADMDERLGWKEPGEAKVEPQPVTARQSNPEKVRVPGTKVHNIPFHGDAHISRRMACYWRGKTSKPRHEEYLRCCTFIRSLLKRPWPTAPSTEGMASTVPLFNALLNLSYGHAPNTAPSR